MKILRSLTLGRNKLTRIPDLTNINSKLEYLYLGFNRILAVDGIPSRSKLRLIELRYNRLVEFPDLRNASSTLETLGLFNNEIRSIRTDLLSPLVALKRLRMGGSVDEQIIRLPNICAMGRTRKSLTIHLKSNRKI